MSKIKSFSEWVDINDDKKFRDIFDEVLSYQIEILEQIREIASEYKDDGCGFHFRLGCYPYSYYYTIYESDNLDELRFAISTRTENHKKDALVILDLIAEKTCKVLMKITMAWGSARQINSFYDQLISKFGDAWDVTIPPAFTSPTNSLCDILLKERT